MGVWKWPVFPPSTLVLLEWRYVTAGLGALAAPSSAYFYGGRRKKEGARDVACLVLAAYSPQIAVMPFQVYLLLGGELFQCLTRKTARKFWFLGFFARCRFSVMSISIRSDKRDQQSERIWGKPARPGGGQKMGG